MVVTAVEVGMTTAMAHDSVALGTILILSLVAALIAKEVLAQYKDYPSLAFLYRALKLIWAPLTLATLLVLGQQLFHVGVF